jgi:hypothetical protein
MGQLLFFLRLSLVNPDFFPAYTNLAGAYAEQNNFDKVTAQLKLMNDKFPGSSQKIVDRIQEHLARPTDRFFERYVREHLRLSIPATDPSWPAQLKTALSFEQRLYANSARSTFKVLYLNSPVCTEN